MKNFTFRFPAEASEKRGVQSIGGSGSEHVLRFVLLETQARPLDVLQKDLSPINLGSNEYYFQVRDSECTLEFESSTLRKAS